MEPLRTTTVGGEKPERRNRKLQLRISIFVLILVVLTALAVGIYERWPREYFPPTTPGLAARVDTYMGQVMASRAAPGIAVGVVRGDAFVFAKGYGVQHSKEGGSVRPETVFHTASVSKTFVALAVMQLVERGQLDLDAPVTRFLPYFRLADLRSAELITVRQLLSHTSGLPTDVEGGNWWESPEQDPGALERYIRSLDNRFPVAGPGDKWHYSNIGYEVLGDVIAKVSGMTFEDYMDVNVFRPLGMRSSTFLPYQGPLEDLAWPHRGNLMPTVSAVYPYHRAHAPSSTLKSNLPDLGRWLAVHFNRGLVNGNRILSSSLMESMWESQAEVDDSGLKMALGWFLRRHRGNRMILHAGRDPGFNTCIALLPDHGVGVILLSNYDGQSAFEMVEIADGLLDIGQGRPPSMPRASILIPLAKTLARDGVPAVIEEYRRLRKDDRYSYTNSDLSTLGHELRRRNRLEEAIQLYSLNAAEHPEYFAPYLFLAETYLKIGDETRALDYYRKGLACDPEGRWGFPLSEYRIDRLEELMRKADR